jgi:hypothetical protein
MQSRDGGTAVSGTHEHTFDVFGSWRVWPRRGWRTAVKYSNLAVQEETCGYAEGHV